MGNLLFADPYAIRKSVAILRLLAACFSETSLLKRLFEKELKGGAFAEAEGIVWYHSVKTITPDTFELVVISSEYWLEDFAATESFIIKFTVDKEVAD